MNKQDLSWCFTLALFFSVYITRNFCNSYNRKVKIGEIMELKLYEIIYKGVVNLIWAESQAEAMKICREGYN